LFLVTFLSGVIVPPVIFSRRTGGPFSPIKLHDPEKPKQANCNQPRAKRTNIRPIGF